MSHFLVDASLPRPVGDLLRSHGHQATGVRDIGMGTAKDPLIQRPDGVRHRAEFGEAESGGEEDRGGPRRSGRRVSGGRRRFVALALAAAVP